MKIKLGSLISINLVIFCVFVSLSYAIDENTVVGIWLFDKGSGNIARDYSGNGYDGEIRPDVKWVKGKFSDALNFPGERTENSYVTIPHQDSLNLVEHSITAWIKVTPTPDDWQIIVSKWKPHDVRNYSILTNKGDGTFFAQITSGGAKQWGTANSGVVVTDDVWHHVACSYDGEIMRVYVDGALKAEQAMGPGDKNEGELTIGARWGGVHPTTGIIDDVGLFSAALDEGEVQDIMKKGLKAFFNLAAVEPLSKLATTLGKIKAKY